MGNVDMQLMEGHILQYLDKIVMYKAKMWKDWQLETFLKIFNQIYKNIAISSQIWVICKPEWSRNLILASNDLYLYH